MLCWVCSGFRAEGFRIRVELSSEMNMEVILNSGSREWTGEVTETILYCFLLNEFGSAVIYSSTQTRIRAGSESFVR